MRVLVALAGGEDGATFVLEDPTRVRVADDAAVVARSRRFGDSIELQNVELVAQTRSLFGAPALPLDETR
ncbi:hypothetical protein PINS_up010529 [Pythium insidiosum]|nr:hypothetical protein PINS_up010529 [Pythium insidiosum]